MQELPSGTVTLLFADIEGSTALVRELGAARYAAVRSLYRRLMREAVVGHGGVEVDAEGDAFLGAFSTVREAIAGAADAQRRLRDGPVLVRMGVHTGDPLLVEGEYAGLDVHRAARIAAAGHGGQVLLSQSTRELLEPAADVRDLGRYRLKDLGEPVRLYQVGGAEFPPLRSLNSTNLPIQPTPLIGRERELEEVGRLLRTRRLVTLTGPGGSGKTRLALQLAADSVEDFPDGVVWIPLQSLSDPELVMPTITRAIGVGNALVDASSSRRMLLVLDNFEQLLPSAPKVRDLLTRLPDTKVLVTSREPLHLGGEHEYAVAPLSESDAVSLFTERARAVAPEFAADEVTVEICRRLDCLPLALELAAARVKALSTEELLRRLAKRLPVLTGGPRDAPERHRTLRATIAWSYELLTADEQDAFARLAVFTGGCTLAAAEEVCRTEMDTIAALVDKSLLRRSGDRYWMLELIAEYAGECLLETGERESLRERHAQYFLDQARSVEPLIRSPQAAALLDRLEQDHANLRAALAWLAGSPSDRPLRLAVWGLAARLHRLGDTALERRDFVEAARFYRESLEIGRHLDDELQTAYSLAGLAAVAAEQGSRGLASWLWGTVNGFELESGSRLHEAERARYQQHLGELESAPEFEEGRSITLAEAVEQALLRSE
jgi:predicted ATPase/class 3 adenylate cyclase